MCEDGYLVGSPQLNESAALILIEKQQLGIMEPERLSDCRSRTIAQPNPNYFGRVAVPGADG